MQSEVYDKEDTEMILDKKMFAETRDSLERLGLPSSDNVVDKQFAQTFSDGSHYGIELSSMNNPQILSQALKLAKRYRVKVDRVIECRGIMRLPDAEIQQMVAMCADEQIGLLLSIGPRAISDNGSFVHSANGKRVGYRLRGMENVVHAVEDVKRALALGVRGFLIYDEGLLMLLNKMRAQQELPNNIILKYSVHAGCANPLSAKLLEEQGADTINIIPDLDVAMIKTFRDVIDAPLDVFSDTAKEAGGLLRTYDVPNIIRYAAPVYFKCGPISQPFQNHLPSVTELEERVKQARNVVEHIQRYLPEAISVSTKEPTLALPNTCATEQVFRASDVMRNINCFQTQDIYRAAANSN